MQARPAGLDFCNLCKEVFYLADGHYCYADERGREGYLLKRAAGLLPSGPYLVNVEVRYHRHHGSLARFWFVTVDGHKIPGEYGNEHLAQHAYERIVTLLDEEART